MTALPHTGQSFKDVLSINSDAHNDPWRKFLTIPILCMEKLGYRVSTCHMVRKYQDLNLGRLAPSLHFTTVL
jgi:hypothetical protein